MCKLHSATLQCRRPLHLGRTEPAMNSPDDRCPRWTPWHHWTTSGLPGLLDSMHSRLRLLGRPLDSMDSVPGVHVAAPKRPQYSLTNLGTAPAPVRVKPPPTMLSGRRKERTGFVLGSLTFRRLLRRLNCVRLCLAFSPSVRKNCGPASSKIGFHGPLASFLGRYKWAS